MNRRREFNLERNSARIYVHDGSCRAGRHYAIAFTDFIASANADHEFNLPAQDLFPSPGLSFDRQFSEARIGSYEDTSGSRMSSRW